MGAAGQECQTAEEQIHGTSEELRMQLLQTIFRFKRIANYDLGTRVADESRGISLAEFMLMLAIDGNEEGNPANTSPTEIGRTLSVTKGAVSQMLGALEEKGYLTRSVSPSNRRSVLVLLTDKGRSVLYDEASTFNAKLDALIEAVGHDDIERLIAIVGKLTSVLKRSEFTEGN